MRPSMIHRLIDTVTKAFHGLGGRGSDADIESIAVLVHRVMSFQSREFHTLDHVFGFLDEAADEVTAFAAIFHDLIYFQVDEGLPAEVEELLSRYLLRQGQELSLAAGISAMDLPYQDCLAIFGFSSGDKLKAFGGLNEFLSALVMAETLSPFLSRATIAEIAAAIEASIPFRGKDGSGREASELLFARLSSIKHAGKPLLGADAARKAVSRAMDFANRDVRDFSLEDPARFLSNTWKLLPESNASLRRRGAFTIREYRIALQKMLGFFVSLDPERIYHGFENRPPDAERAAWADMARRNLEFARGYLRAKLLATGSLEALAVASGGDAPMALFMGDVDPQGEGRQGLIDLLPPATTPSCLDSDDPVYALLRDGREDDSSFDLRNSPLAVYLCHRLDSEAWQEGEGLVTAFFEGRIKAEELLAGMDRGLVADLAKACASLVPGRRIALNRLAAGP